MGKRPKAKISNIAMILATTVVVGVLIAASSLGNKEKRFREMSGVELPPGYRIETHDVGNDYLIDTVHYWKIVGPQRPLASLLWANGFIPGGDPEQYFAQSLQGLYGGSLSDYGGALYRGLEGRTVVAFEPKDQNVIYIVVYFF